MNYKDVYIVQDFDEAEQFRYEHNDQVVEPGTPVAFESLVEDESIMVCFEGIYYVEHQ